jgi:hypothetical protein
MEVGSVEKVAAAPQFTGWKPCDTVTSEDCY